MFARATAAATPPGEMLPRLRDRLNQPVEQRLLPTHPVLAGLLPEGGLRKGATYALDPSGALLLALLAEPSREGAWCGVAGVPEFGAEAAELAGVRLERLVLVPHPGERWLSVVAALADVFDVVALRPPGRVRESDAVRLAARLREKGTVLLVLGSWPQAVARLAVAEPRWSGLGAGHGHLCEREVTVTVTAKRAPLPRSARLLLPDQGGRPAAAAPEVPATGALRVVV